MKPLVTLQKEKEPYRYDSFSGRLLRECTDRCEITDGCLWCPSYDGNDRCVIERSLEAEVCHYLDNNQEGKTMPDNLIKEPVGWYRVHHSHGCGEVVLYSKVKPVVGQLIIASNLMLLDGTTPSGTNQPYCKNCKRYISPGECLPSDATLIEEPQFEFHMPVENRYEFKDSKDFKDWIKEMGKDPYLL